jgi:3-phenylpropionate/cinnamic acid dioxygenase small subunit
MNLEDRLDVSEVLARYGHVVDRGELHRLGAVFTADVVYDMSAVGLPVMQGIDALRDGALRLGAQNPVAHHVTDILVSAGEGDEVNVESKGLMLTVEGAVRSVTHHDIVRRTVDGWRIARRTIIPQRRPLGGLVDVEGGQQADLG